jgi:hypothetical protein
MAEASLATLVVQVVVAELDRLLAVLELLVKDLLEVEDEQELRPPRLGIKAAVAVELAGLAVTRQ